MQQHHSGSLQPKKFKIKNLAGNVMTINVLVKENILVTDNYQKNQTANAEL